MKQIAFFLFLFTFLPSVFAQDSDGDSLPDEWENRYGYDIRSDTNTLAEVNLKKESSWPGYGRDDAKAIAAWGHYAYVTIEYGGFVVFDISNVDNPVVIARRNTADCAQGVCLKSNLLVVANAGSGINIYDVSVPSNPQLLATQDTPYARGVSVDADHAYVATSDGVTIIDIQNPTNPIVVSSVDTEQNAYAIAVSNGYAYVATDAGGGLEIIDISDFANPTSIATCALGRAYDVKLSGSYAYVAAYTNGLQIIDISVPTNPAIIGKYICSYAQGVDVAGNYAYLVGTSYDEIRIFDVSVVTNPVLVADKNLSSSAYDVEVQGDMVCIANYSDGMTLIDLNNPSNMVVRSQSDTAGEVLSVCALDEYAYLASDEMGLEILNIDDLTAPVLVNRITQYGDVHCVDLYQGLLSAGIGDKLYFFDISDPVNPVIKGTEDMPGFMGTIYDIAFDGDYAYLATFMDGLYIVDIGSTDNPYVVGHVDPGGWCYGVSVSGNYAFLACHFYGFRVVDISDKVNPVEVFSYNTTGVAYDCKAVDGCLYVAGSVSGLFVFDISVPTNPVYLRKMSFDTDGLCMVGDYLFASGGDGVAVFNISDGANPYLVSEIGAPGEGKGIFLVGTNVYLADNSQGLSLFSSIVDLDRDNLSDEWERTHFGTTHQSATNDFDNDGISNWGEYLLGLLPSIMDSDGDGISDGDEIIAGTHPCLETNTFCVSQINAPTHSTGCVLEWPGVSGRYYDVYYRVSLRNSSWVSCAQNISGIDGKMSFTNSYSGEDLRYYQLRVDQNPFE